MTDRKKRKGRRPPTDMSTPESVAPSPDDLIPHIPGTPEDIARSMFGKRMLADGTFEYTEEGLRIRREQLNQQ
ncbi:MAG: hypothetical protein OXH22_11570 [Chloroflexi bacterium]|nr:hypothetical protein [Chloroflexota bacterium]